MSLADQVLIIYAGTRGFADNVAIERMRAWENDLLRYMESSHPEVVKDIAEKKRITEQNEEALRKGLETFNSTWR
jgi:F-type H+-transporting ATPase subunit alpha